MKKFLLFLISVLAGLGLLFWVIQVIGWGKIKLAFLTFSGWNGLVVLAFTILMLIVGNWRWKEILKKQGNDIPFFSLFRFYLAGFSFFFFAPIIIFGGETFRAYLLREKYSIPWPKGMASVITDRMSEITIYIFVILTGVIYLFSKNLPPKNLGLVLGGILVFFVVGISFFYFKIVKKESIFKFFGRIFHPQLDDGEPFQVEKEFFKLLKPTKAFFWKMIGLSGLKCSLALGRIWFLIFSLGKAMNFLSTLSVLGFSYLAALVPIPAALGAHEAFQTLAFNGLGLKISLVPVLTMVIRGSEMVLALIGLFILFRLGTGLLGDLLFKKIKKFSNWLS